jgi:hypothetical protein
MGIEEVDGGDSDVMRYVSGCDVKGLCGGHEGFFPGKHWIGCGEEDRFIHRKKDLDIAYGDMVFTQTTR